eukprot:13457-Heterococcus_DN1.PRE.4
MGLNTIQHAQPTTGARRDEERLLGPDTKQGSAAAIGMENQGRSLASSQMISDDRSCRETKVGTHTTASSIAAAALN